MTAYPEDAWQEFCLIDIQEKGGANYQFAGITEDITAMDWGEKDVEGIALANGGRVVKRTPMTDESITFKCYPLSAELSQNGIVQWMHPQGTAISDASVVEPIAVANTNFRRKHRVVLLWASELPATPTGAATATTGTDAAYRMQIFNAYLTSYKPSFDDKIMSAEMTFKWAPFQKDGTRNKIEESTSGTSAVLPAVTAFV